MKSLLDHINAKLWELKVSDYWFLVFTVFTICYTSRIEPSKWILLNKCLFYKTEDWEGTRGVCIC